MSIASHARAWTSCTIVLDGFSKTYAMTGWRLGYGIMPARSPSTSRLLTNAVSCTASFTQLAGVEALKGDHTPVDAMVAEFRQRRDVIVDGLREMPGIKCRGRRAPSTSSRTSALEATLGELADRCSTRPASLPLGHRVRRVGRRPPAFLLRELRGQSSQGARPHGALWLARLDGGGERASGRARLMPTVAQLIVEGLRHAGVARIFGVPGGGSNLELIEAARAQGLPFVLCHQEGPACIMAAVTGELTGRPGAALSTLGRGVTASATGLAYARLDRGADDLS